MTENISEGHLGLEPNVPVLQKSTYISSNGYLLTFNPS